MVVLFPFIPAVTALAALLASTPGHLGDPRVRVAIGLQQRVIVRVPRMPMPRPVRPRAMPPVTWVERGKRDCVPIRSVAGAASVGRGSVDLMLADGSRVRARLGSQCPALDFYSGFYLKPSADGKLCAKRDVLRARSGTECPVERMRTLVPDR